MPDTVTQAASNAAKIAPYIGPVASILGIGAQMYTNMKNREMQEKINQDQERLIREQNSYNSPVAQMARYKAAGLNPLAFMNNIGPGNQEAVANLGTPQYETPDFGQVGDQVFNSLAYRLNEGLTKSKVDANNASALANIARAGNIEQQTTMAKALFGYQEQEFQLRLQNWQEMVNNAKATYKEITARTNNIEEQTKGLAQERHNAFRRWNLWSAEEAAYYSQVEHNWHGNAMMDAQTIGFNIRNSADLETAKFTVALYGTLNRRGFGSLLAGTTMISSAYGLLDQKYQTKLLRQSSEAAFLNNLYLPSFLNWRNENMRSQAGMSWDEWQQGQARKNFHTYVTEPVSAISSMLNMGNMMYQTLNGSWYQQQQVGNWQKPSMFPSQSPSYDFGNGSDLGTFYGL